MVVRVVLGVGDPEHREHPLCQCFHRLAIEVSLTAGVWSLSHEPFAAYLLTQNLTHTGSFQQCVALAQSYRSEAVRSFLLQASPHCWQCRPHCGSLVQGFLPQTMSHSPLTEHFDAT